MLLSHLDPLDQDAPGGGPLVQELLDAAGDALPLTQDFVQVLGPEDVPQGGLGQHPGAVVAVLHVSHGNGRVRDAEEDNSVHRHRHAVLCQDLKMYFIYKEIIKKKIENLSSK